MAHSFTVTTVFQHNCKGSNKSDGKDASLQTQLQLM